MKRASVVIGANFGDEGKGLMTDYLSEPDGVVMRFNGGAQAGHTVELPNGTRHVFHHYGAGALKGASTFLSRHFISNPLLLDQERTVLQGLGVHPRIAADPRGMVTTPYDMMLNQMAEEGRGGQRHGSCGIGINETIKRHEAGLELVLAGIYDGPRLALWLNNVRKEWLPERAKALGLMITPEWQARIDNDDILLAYVEACSDFGVTLVSVADHLRGFGSPGYNIVFEGAQGLLLDEGHRFFPHVTHSHTGLRNVLEIAREAHITDLDVTYVTRAYATRHGAGPFPGEQPDLRYDDPTNVPNDWQGTLRFGHLDLDLLAESVQHDLKQVSGSCVAVHPVMAVTCLDQLGPLVSYRHQGHSKSGSTGDLLLDIQRATQVPIRYLCHGPTRDFVSVSAYTPILVKESV